MAAQAFDFVPHPEIQARYSYPSSFAIDFSDDMSSTWNPDVSNSWPCARIVANRQATPIGPHHFHCPQGKPFAECLAGVNVEKLHVPR